MSASDGEIREAGPDDAPALVAVQAAIDAETVFLNRPGEYGDWPARAAALLRRWHEDGSGAYLLAETGGEIVGYLSILRGGFRRVAGTASITQIGLRAAHRGLGLGGRLLAAAEAWAGARSVHRLELRVDAENTRGLALYRRMGFRIEGTIPRSLDQDGQWRTHHWMGRLLVPVPATVPEGDPRPPCSGHGLDGIVIRPPRGGDAAAFRAWEIRLLAETPWAYKTADEVAPEQAIAVDLVEALGDPRRLTLLATTTDEGRERILGVLGAGFAEHRMRHDCAVGLDVLGEASGRGIGRALAARLERWAVDNGARRLTCHPAAQNLRAVRFAERLGYRREVLSPAAALVDGRAVDRLRLGRLVD